MSNFEGILELKIPLTKECWDKLADVELENTERMWFTTPSRKRVEYIKADVLDKIRADIKQMDFDFGDFYDHTSTIREMVLEVIDKYNADIEPQERSE